MLNEEVIDVTSEEVVVQEPEQPTIQTYLDEYREFKRSQRKLKQLKQQIQNNIKSQRGFGYTYKEISYDS